MTHHNGIETIPSADGPIKFACTCADCNAPAPIVAVVPNHDPAAAAAAIRRVRIAQSYTDPSQEEPF